MSSAYLLVSHGSRDPRHQIAVEQLVHLISQSLVANDGKLRKIEKTAVGVQSRNGGQGSRSRHSPLANSVGAAYLELSPLPLHQQIVSFGDRAIMQGYNRLQIVPLFLLPGVHVMEDIPAQVAIAQETLGQKLKLDLKPYLGTHPGLVHLLATGLASTQVEAWILLAHGSRRAGSKQPVTAIAQQLGALPAYWSFAPSFQSRVQELVKAGYEQIGIIPYFLFAGGITDAIALAVSQLQGQFPASKLHLAEPLGASQELADLILDLID